MKVRVLKSTGKSKPGDVIEVRDRDVRVLVALKVVEELHEEPSERPRRRYTRRDMEPETA